MISNWYIDRLGLLAFTVLLASGQLLFKHVGLAIRGSGPLQATRLLAFSVPFYLSLLLYFCATLLWVWILSRIPLTLAYPWTALGMAIVPLLSMIVFGERVGPLFWLGVALIGSGIILTQYGLES